VVDGNKLPLVLHGLSEAQVAASVRFLRRVIASCVEDVSHLPTPGTAE
jgi:hypothetical protein